MAIEPLVLICPQEHARMFQWSYERYGQTVPTKGKLHLSSVAGERQVHIRAAGEDDDVLVTCPASRTERLTPEEFLERFGDQVERADFETGSALATKGRLYRLREEGRELIAVRVVRMTVASMRRAGRRAA